jgi:hypothetical protein
VCTPNVPQAGHSFLWEIVDTSYSSTNYEVSFHYPTVDEPFTVRLTVTDSATGAGASTTQVLTATGGGGGPFNPETDIAWHSLFWAEGTAFTALGLADGAAVTEWPNETGESDMTEATNQPVFVESGVGGQPSVDFTAASSQKLTSATFSTAPSGAITYVVIFKSDITTGTPRLMCGTADSSQLYVASNTALWFGRTGGGTFLGPSGTYDTADHLLTAYMDPSGNELMMVDGVAGTPTAAGSTGTTNLRVAADDAGGNFFDGKIAFAGIYEGDILQDAKIQEFANWVSDHYGIIITPPAAI